MPILYGDPPRLPRSSLRLPASRRMSMPNAQRLTTITEGSGSDGIAPDVPSRNSLRNSTSHSETNSRRVSSRWSTSAASQRTAPPPYDWVPEPIVGGTSGEVVMDDRLEKLRRGEPQEKTSRRGGWKRVALLVVLVLAVVVGLGVGLGVGLTRQNHSNASGSGNAGSGTQDSPPQNFPLGKYSLVTALREVKTSCTSNPATWRCFPYTIYNSTDGADANSLASFNWIITNTSTSFASNTTDPTPAKGIPANLTVSSTNDPFGIMFTNKSLVYHYDSGNATSRRYTFDFTLTKTVIPSQAITSDDSNTKCLFDDTVFTASIYLEAPHSLANGVGIVDFGGYEHWPYAVEISQSASGGNGVPKCYKTVDGRRGEQVDTGLTPQSANAQCVCDYRNF